MNLLQKSSFLFLLPFVIGVYQARDGGKRRFVHSTTGALFAVSFANHSRPHDGPVYDDVDLLDKAVIACNAFAGAADALRDEVDPSAVWNCAFLIVISVGGYVIAFSSRKDREGPLGNYGEICHAVFVHAASAIALSVLSV